MFLGAIIALALLPAIGPTVGAQTPAGTLILYNPRWDQVRVDARLGPATDCDVNPPVGTRTMRRNRRWAFVTADYVCWRREAVPGDAAQGWTEWERVRVPAATKREVAL